MTLPEKENLKVFLVFATIFLFLFVIVINANCPKQPTNNVSKYVRYSDSYCSIEHPKDWLIVNNPDEMTDVYIGSKTENIAFTILHFPTNESLSTINSVGDAELIRAGFTIENNIKTSINNMMCYKSIQILSMNGTDAKFLSYSFKKGEMFYNVKFSNVNTIKNMNLALEIISTFYIK